MSCGKPHARDCAEILAKLYFFLDNEIDDASCVEIREHLLECAPCLAKYDVDRVVKDLVARSCCELAPEPLRDRVLTSIRSVHVELNRGEFRPHQH
jgi:mycothiol system anti-sigma-R factor